ncbi:hypothetical protein CBR_g51210 [Chara braunii]|uniref:F-box domain-containing protein n=1 Tax=Chara braunii TaxID=69332 RepID=A0A388M813_CHABU|nr:hypothetical protein CBR_g51210 [Chara braunii]|eukprot:GBG90701.1 hypothetical protein CBR_g51210 [Chara braunii]
MNANSCWARPSKRATTIDDLSDECLCLTFEKLALSRRSMEFRSVSRVCKRWNTLAGFVSDRLDFGWCADFASQRLSADLCLSRVLVRFPNLVSLRIDEAGRSSLPPTQSLTDVAAKRAGSALAYTLRDLEIDGCAGLTVHGVVSLLLQCKALRRLRLRGLRLRCAKISRFCNDGVACGCSSSPVDDSLVQALADLRTLEDVSVTECSGLLSGRHVESILRSNKGIRRLTVELGCLRDARDVVVEESEGHPRLEKLRLFQLETSMAVAPPPLALPAALAVGGPNVPAAQALPPPAVGVQLPTPQLGTLPHPDFKGLGAFLPLIHCCAQSLTVLHLHGCLVNRDSMYSLMRACKQLSVLHVIGCRRVESPVVLVENDEGLERVGGGGAAGAAGAAAGAAAAAAAPPAGGAGLDSSLSNNASLLPFPELTCPALVELRGIRSGVVASLSGIARSCPSLERLCLRETPLPFPSYPRFGTRNGAFISDELRALAEGCSSLVDVEICPGRVDFEALMNLGERCRVLQRLTLANFVIQADEESEVAEREDAMSLEGRDGGDEGEGAGEVGKGFDEAAEGVAARRVAVERNGGVASSSGKAAPFVRLQELNLENCVFRPWWRVKALLSSTRSLSRLSVGDVCNGVLSVVAMHCPRLRYLDMCMGEGIGRRVVQDLTARCRLLTAVSISGGATCRLMGWLPDFVRILGTLSNGLERLKLTGFTQSRGLWEAIASSHSESLRELELHDGWIVDSRRHGRAGGTSVVVVNSDRPPSTSSRTADEEAYNYIPSPFYDKDIMQLVPGKFSKLRRLIISRVYSTVPSISWADLATLCPTIREFVYQPLSENDITDDWLR